MIGIYCIENNINHKKYIGQSKLIEKRLISHKKNLDQNKHVNAHLQQAYNLYNGNFSFYILQYCNKSQLDDLEIKFIAKYDTCGKGGYNNTYGGNANKKVSLATRTKLSLARKGISNVSRIGTHLSEATKIKMSLTTKGRSNWWSKGIKMSKETRNKMSLAHKGKPHPYKNKGTK